jgi:hypothetical protein
MTQASPLLPKQTPNVLRALKDTETRYDVIQSLWLEMCQADEGAFFPVDMVAMGAVKRCASQSYGLRLFVEGWNLLCARALLRMQIDTALRFSALWLVNKPHDVAREILRGERLDKMKDRDGKRLTDAYLITKLAPDQPWLPEVYERTSGYIHFSGAHLFSPIAEVRNESREVEYIIGETDTNYPESSWVEVVNCFNQATDIFMHYLAGWVRTKRSQGPNDQATRNVSQASLSTV